MVRSLGRGLAWGAFALVGLAATLVLVVPLVIGAERYTILGGSMEPAIPLGSLVVVQPRELNDIRVGDVITYQLESGEATVATHRVVGEGLVGDGERVLVTQGDANDSADIEPVRGPQVRGVLLYSIPLLGWMNVLISGELRMWVVPVVSGALLLYAAWMFVSAWRDRRRRMDEVTAEEQVEHQPERVPQTQD
ncbi:Signal peptidase I [Microbacterium sp. C448]|uniref:signal peptidase I n=1 Tax=Microbacterium TaxID=33882 RepID=UPI0003DE7157|nr:MULTISPECIES: signal peptidase I [Microbacterium]CDJ99938.1 Signal peptidase I [Microbacterium sp. C448]